MRVRDLFILSWNNLRGNKFRRNITIFSVSICSFIILILFSFNNTMNNFDDMDEEERDELLKISVSGKQTQQGGLMEAGQSKIFTEEEFQEFMASVDHSPGIQNYTIEKELSGYGTIHLGEFMNDGGIKGVNKEALVEIPDTFYVKGSPIQGAAGILVNQTFAETFIAIKDQNQIRKNIRSYSPDVIGKELVLNLTANYIDERGRQEKQLASIPVHIDGILKDEVSFFGDKKSDDEDPNRVKILYLPLEIMNEIKKPSFALWNHENTRIQLQVHSIENMTSVLNMLNEKDIATHSLHENLQRIQYIILVIRLIFGVFVCILFIVTGIGIFNTMMLSVSERKSEIGIAKSLGGSMVSIRWLFMMESMYIGLLGSILGIFAGLGTSFMINLIYRQIIDIDIIGLHKISTISLSSIIVGILIPILLSLFASFIPSEKAAKMSVLEAIKK